MRKFLTLAIEIISIATALGVIVSAFIYSLQFAAIGLSYMAFASLSDMLRDSIKLLILFLAAVVAIGFPLLLMAFTQNAQKSIGGRAVLAIILTTFMVGVLVLVIYVAGAVGGVATTLPYRENPVIFVSFVILITILAFVAYTKAPQTNLLRILEAAGKSITSPPSSVLLLIIFTSVVAYPVYSASRTIMRQLENGLQMKVEIGDVEACKSRRSYTTIWIGENKAVVRCKSPEIYVVKVIN